MESVEYVVIGAGVVGLAIARRLALAGREVVVLEAEAAIGRHASGRNSEVIHAGIYSPPHFLKTRLCVEGRRALYTYAAERDVPHRRVGKLLVATSEAEIPKLKKLHAMAEANGVVDLVPLTAAEVRAMEPAVSAVAGLWSPSTGIVDACALMACLRADLVSEGGTLVLSSPFVQGRVTPAGIEIEVGGVHPVWVRCKALVNSAGLFAPKVARALEGMDRGLIPRQYFARGQYFTLGRPSPFKHLVYPVPAPGALGIHVTLDLDGRARFGPDLTWTEELSYDFDEGRAPDFYRAIRRYSPELAEGDLQPGYVGVRPKIVPQGAPAADFVIQGPETHSLPGLINLFGIESPGLTASLAIAEEVARRLGL